ncbi:MAG: PilN domain-containing protein [Pseudobdellovibrionaceae bacterium]
MIRVNLVKVLPIVNPATGTIDITEGIDLAATDIQRQGVIRLLILLIFPLALFGYEFQNLPDLRSKLASKTAVVNSLTEKNNRAKGAVDEIAKFKEDQSRLQKQIDTLEGLQKERLREVKILDNLQKDIPEKVWLTRMEFADTNLRVSGAATADLEISTFMDNLGRSVFLRDVSLVKSTNETSDKGVLKIFDILCTIDRPTVNEVKR